MAQPPDTGPGKIHSRRRLHPAIRWALILLMVVVGVVLFLGHELVRSHWGDLRFDPVVWKAHPGSTEVKNPRGQMVDDLGRQLRPGLSTTEVMAMLGKPDSGEGTTDYWYNVGSWSFMPIDDYLFVLSFDDEGKLRSWGLIHTS